MCVCVCIYIYICIVNVGDKMGSQISGELCRKLVVIWLVKDRVSPKRIPFMGELSPYAHSSARKK